MYNLNYGFWQHGVQDIPEPVWIFLAKALGAVTGSAVSIAYMLPKGRREAAIRFLVGVTAGLVFGTAVAHKMAEQLDLSIALSKFELTLAGATLASLCAWWALGVLARLAEKFSRSR